MRGVIKQVFFGFALGTACFAASAGVSTYSDRTTFNVQGTIWENNNFADFGASYNYPGTPFTRGHVTYTSAENLTIGAGSDYSIGDFQTVMSNNYWSPLTGTISNQYSMLGFDAAVTSGAVNITVSTNLNTYSFNGLSLPNGSPTFAFEGFKTTGGGEYFTQFRIDTLGAGYLPGISNVTLGTLTPIPEPETYALMLAGLGLLSLAMLRKAKH
ncbi:hypothetical protein AAKU55_002483 [Oxalobacteraceae bacterium GrIS 1.11]